MEYKVLKNFIAANGAEFKEEDVVNSEDTSLPAEEISDLIISGDLDPIIDESLYETITVDQAYLDAHPDEAAQGIEVGHQLMRLKVAPELSDEEKAAAEKATADAKAEADAKEAADKATAEETTPSDSDEVPPAKTMTYRGQIVVTDGLRTTGEGKEVHSIRLADGSITDVTDDEYEIMVRDAK